MRVLLSCSHVFTTVWLHNLEVAPPEAATVWPLTSHLTNHPIKRRQAGHYWRSQNTHKQCSMDSYIWARLPDQQKLIFTNSVWLLSVV